MLYNRQNNTALCCLSVAICMTQKTAQARTALSNKYLRLFFALFAYTFTILYLFYACSLFYDSKSANNKRISKK